MVPSQAHHASTCPHCQPLPLLKNVSQSLISENAVHHTIQAHCVSTCHHHCLLEDDRNDVDDDKIPPRRQWQLNKDSQWGPTMTITKRPSLDNNNKDNAARMVSKDQHGGGCPHQMTTMWWGVTHQQTNPLLDTTGQYWLTQQAIQRPTARFPTV